MSSTYSIVCMNHDPAIETDVHEANTLLAALSYIDQPNASGTDGQHHCVLADMKALMDAYASLPQTGWNVAEKGPIKLTRWQLACLKQERPAPLHHYGGVVSNLLAFPFVEVATTEESTPYTEGWIKP